MVATLILEAQDAHCAAAGRMRAFGCRRGCAEALAQQLLSWLCFSGECAVANRTHTTRAGLCDKARPIMASLFRRRKKVDIGGLDELITTSTVGGEENVAANISICDMVNVLRTPEE